MKHIFLSMLAFAAIITSMAQSYIPTLTERKNCTYTIVTTLYATLGYYVIRNYRNRREPQARYPFGENSKRQMAKSLPIPPLCFGERSLPRMSSNDMPHSTTMRTLCFSTTTYSREIRSTYMKATHCLLPAIIVGSRAKPSKWFP